MIDIERRLSGAVQHFWLTRTRQARLQGRKSRSKDHGQRGAVTGGRQLDGIVSLVGDLLRKSGIPDASIFRNHQAVIPGFFRPTKIWDLLVVADGRLLAAVEFKSQVGPSFGNNFNNRTEEAIGSATDIRTAYREGAFALSDRPWLGFLMLLEETSGSTSPVAIEEPHFKVFKEFHGTSYATRYELLALKLLREQLYDATCLILTDRKRGLKGEYREPSPELTFRRFAESLSARASAFARMRSGR